MDKDKKLTMECDTCGDEFEMTPSNSVIIAYPREPEFTHLRTRCPSCSQVYSLFLDMEMTEYMSKRFGIAAHDEVPKELREFKTKLDEAETPDDPEPKPVAGTYELIPRQEELIAELARVLGSTPDEWLMEIFYYPPPKSTLPRRWI